MAKLHTQLPKYQHSLSSSGSIVLRPLCNPETQRINGKYRKFTTIHARGVDQTGCCCVVFVADNVEIQASSAVSIELSVCLHSG